MKVISTALLLALLVPGIVHASGVGLSVIPTPSDPRPAAKLAQAHGFDVIKLWPRDLLSPEMKEIYRYPFLKVFILKPPVCTMADCPFHWDTDAAKFFDEVKDLHKTFILTEWEMDWQLRGLGNRTGENPDPLRTLLFWSRVGGRERIVQQVRASAPGASADLLYAPEVNLLLPRLRGVTVPGAAEDEQIVTMTHNVLSLLKGSPYQPDLISYSAWEVTNKKTPGLLSQVLDEIEDKTGVSNLFLGEFGSDDPAVIEQTRVEAEQWGALFTVFWNYDDFMSGDLALRQQRYCALLPGSCLTFGTSWPTFGEGAFDFLNIFR